MARPPGIPNRPGSAKPGRKSGSTRIPQLTDAQIIEYKFKLLSALQNGAPTLSVAARECGISELRAHQMARKDKEFNEMLAATREVKADALEEELGNSNNPIPKMMILKGTRPMFRDNFKLELNSDKLESLLQELRKAGEKPVVEQEKIP